MTDTTQATVELSAEQAHAIQVAAFDLAQAERNHESEAIKALEVVQANGGFGQKAVRDNFYIGDMAGRMAKLKGRVTKSMLEEATLMRWATGANSKTTVEGTPKRSPEWEAAYAASRKAWERLLAKANVASTETRGGARERETSKAEKSATDPADVKAKDAPKPQEPTVPKATDKASANKWLAEMSARLVAFSIHNQSVVPEPISILIDQFRKDLMPLLKD